MKLYKYEMIVPKWLNWSIDVYTVIVETWRHVKLKKKKMLMQTCVKCRCPSIYVICSSTNVLHFHMDFMYHVHACKLFKCCIWSRNVTSYMSQREKEEKDKHENKKKK